MAATSGHERTSVRKLRPNGGATRAWPTIVTPRAVQAPALTFTLHNDRWGLDRDSTDREVMMRRGPHTSSRKCFTSIQPCGSRAPPSVAVPAAPRLRQSARAALKHREPVFGAVHVLRIPGASVSI